jgi:hypothetical protein
MNGSRRTVQVETYYSLTLTSYDDQINDLRDHVRKAVERAGGLDDSVWPPGETRERLNEVLVYTQMVLERSDSALVPHSAGSEAEATLAEFINAPETIAQQANDWCDRLLNILPRFPPAQGRDLEQDAKDAAATFQRSAQQRQGQLDREARAIRTDMESVKAAMSQLQSDITSETTARLDELRHDIASLQNGFEERLQSYETTLATEREEWLRQRSQQAEEFQAAQGSRASEYKEAIDGALADLNRREDEVMKGLEASRVRVEEVVGVLVASSTAGGFAKEANQQKEEADTWRIRAIWLGFLALGIAVFAVVYAIAVKTETNLILAKAAAAVAAAGIAGYAAKQSAEHRGREAVARRLALEVAAFDPMAEALDDPDKRQEARKAYMDKLFVGDQTSIAVSDNSAGLTGGDLSLVAQLFDIFKKARG